MSSRTTTYQPTKKPKGKELTVEQKEQNKQISKERTRVEHSIGGVKRLASCEIFSTTCERDSMTWSWKPPVVCIICAVISH